MAWGSANLLLPVAAITSPAIAGGTAATGGTLAATATLRQHLHYRFVLKDSRAFETMLTRSDGDLVKAVQRLMRRRQWLRRLRGWFGFAGRDWR